MSRHSTVSAQIAHTFSGPGLGPRAQAAAAPARQVRQARIGMVQQNQSLDLSMVNVSTHTPLRIHATTRPDSARGSNQAARRPSTSRASMDGLCTPLMPRCLMQHPPHVSHDSPGDGVGTLPAQTTSIARTGVTIRTSFDPSSPAPSPLRGLNVSPPVICTLIDVLLTAYLALHVDL